MIFYSVYAQHIFCIHLSDNGYSWFLTVPYEHSYENCYNKELGRAYIFGIRWFHVFLTIPRTAIAELYGSSGYSCLGSCLLTSILAGLACIPNNSVYELFFLYVLTKIRFFFFGHSYSDGRDVVVHCHFDLHSPSN